MNQSNPLIVNETPVKTSKNFKINNLVLDEFEMPQVKPFNGMKLTIPDTKRCKPYEEELSLEGGMGEIFLRQSKEEHNISLELTIPEGMDVATPVELVFPFTKENITLVDTIVIHGGKDSKAQIILKYFVEDGVDLSTYEAYRNSVLKGDVEAGAELNVTVVNSLSNGISSFYSNELSVSEQARVTMNYIDFGSKHSVVNMRTTLARKEGHSHMNVIYIGIDEQILDYNLITVLEGEQTVGNIEVQGVVDDYARKSFKGTLDFKRGATQSVGYENEYCIMLADTPTSLSLPMLLCEEEDVEGNHSCASGKVDDKVMFYIQSRGISEEEARKLIVKANFHAILQSVQDKDTREEIIQEIDRRL
ncbi:MAG: SufD family Fe-S cluster assembly protein [Eubacteriales bacterium]